MDRVWWQLDKGGFGQNLAEWDGSAGLNNRKQDWTDGMLRRAREAQLVSSFCLVPSPGYEGPGWKPSRREHGAGV